MGNNFFREKVFNGKIIKLMKKEPEKPENQDPKPLAPRQQFLKELREIPYDISIVGQSLVTTFTKPSVM